MEGVNNELSEGQRVGTLVVRDLATETANALYDWRG